MSAAQYPPPYTLTATAIYACGRDGDCAPMAASGLREQARQSRALEAAHPGWRSAAAQAFGDDLDKRREQVAAVIDELMPLGLAAVEIGCTFIGSDLSPAALVELATGMTAALLAPPTTHPAYSATP